MFFVPGRGNEVPEWVASGTAFSTPQGRGVVLTADHNVARARDQPLRLGFHRGRAMLEDVVAAIVRHEQLDVALLALKEDPTAAIAGYTLDLTAVAADEDLDAERNAFVLAGFPAAWMMQRWTERAGNKPLWELAFPSVTYGTSLCDPRLDDGGRLRVAWSDREVAGQPPERMPDPEGISGGALWRFRRPTKEEVWSPRTAGRIVGVPVEFHVAERAEKVEPATAWRTWFEEKLQLLDRELPRT